MSLLLSLDYYYFLKSWDKHEEIHLCMHHPVQGSDCEWPGTWGSNFLCRGLCKYALEKRYYVLLMEILRHLGSMKPCKIWDKLPINWCRISYINSSMLTFSWSRLLVVDKHISLSTALRCLWKVHGQGDSVRVTETPSKRTRRNYTADIQVRNLSKVTWHQHPQR